jgi:hypothetical protein
MQVFHRESDYLSKRRAAILRRLFFIFNNEKERQSIYMSLPRVWHTDTQNVRS